MLFGWRRKCRVDDQTVDEYEDVISNLVQLELGTAFVSFLHDVSELVADLIRNVIDVASTGRGGDRVHE